MTQALYELTAWEAAERMAAGTLTSQALVGACLDRIEALEGTIHAWAYLDRDLALAQARRRDAEPRRSPLHGIPVGVKDVIDTFEMPTSYGSKIYQGWRPSWDAACVTILKRVGAVIMGKTVTTAFACGSPVPTANPRNPGHTAGGSSSGSAASVAAGMVPVAIGTQSAGSLIRPSSYNGVVGMKPSFGTISVAGFKYFNGSFDHIGLIGRTVEDVALLWATQLAVEPFRPKPLSGAPRIGYCRTPWWDRCEPATHMVMEEARKRLARQGAAIKDVTLPKPFEILIEVHESIQAFEAARSYAFEYDERHDDLDPKVCQLVERGLKISYARYQELTATARLCRARAPELFTGLDALLAPSAPGEAPEGHGYLGDSFILRPWTLLYGPTMTIPGLTGPKGLPVGIQLICPFGADERLFEVARWVEERIGKAV